MDARVVSQNSLPPHKETQKPHLFKGPSGVSKGAAHDFKDILSGSTIDMAPVLSLNNQSITKEKALNAAKGIMQGFYTQMFKSIFAEVKNEDNEENDYASSMVKDIFLEQLASVMGKHMTSSHEKIAECIMAKSLKENASHSKEIKEGVAIYA